VATQAVDSTPNNRAKRRELVARAASLFNDVGYHNTSMEDIAESVGLRKPTLYHYFKSKDEILFEIHNEMIDLILSRQERRLAEGGGTHADGLRSLMHDIIELMETHPGHLRIFFEHHRELPDEYKVTIRGKRNRYRDLISEEIERGVAAGEFREVDIELTTLAVLGLSNWTYQWLHPGGKHDARAVTDYFCDLLLRGIAADPLDTTRARG
jgi:AcrR family transcriptional regulator